MCQKFSAPKRIGCRGCGAREIKSHAWFNNINQRAILQRRITSPFLPTIKDRDDMNNFDNYEETAISESPEVEFENIFHVDEASTSRSVSMLPKCNGHRSQESNDSSPSMFINGRFRIISTPGKGNYGTVVLAEEKETKKRYAIKIIKKRHLMLSGLGFKQVFSEKKILQMAQFPFIADFYGSFKSYSNLFLMLEFVQGGDLFTHLRKMNRFRENVAKFFAIQIVLALEYLHKWDIIYRDLKPENILLDQHGYCKLADFGMSKQLNNQRTTRDYQTSRIRYQYRLYDLCNGRTPFKAASLNELQQIILKGKKRIGCRGCGAREIKSHAWFNCINQRAILQRRITSPFLPTIKDRDDMYNFDNYEETQFPNRQRSN
ncbi:cAMP-dependent protein kinase catalytic subunit alpha [Trichinella sp. T8]|nr:cAMP-dependent protein kinase catalytic subunit alpha [Trichinella sp. T8]